MDHVTIDEGIKKMPKQNYAALPENFLQHLLKSLTPEQREALLLDLLEDCMRHWTDYRETELEEHRDIERSVKTVMKALGRTTE